MVRPVVDQFILAGREFEQESLPPQTALDDYNQRVGKTRGAEANATNIEEISPIVLHDFWGGAQPEDYSFEATMLRTVDWCEIAGFDSWWHRLEQRLKENTFSHEGTNLLPSWLFAMARSDYAIKVMRRVLERHLELISLSGPNKPEPWMVRTSSTSGRIEQHLSHASAIVFPTIDSRHLIRIQRWCSKL